MPKFTKKVVEYSKGEKLYHKPTGLLTKVVFSDLEEDQLHCMVVTGGTAGRVIKGSFKDFYKLED
jgi:hypothetical protein